MAATYCGNFWGVDRYNKLALGPDSVQYAFRVQDWKHRFFYALMGMCECNAYLAYNQVRQTPSMAPVTRKEWKLHLAKQLLEDPLADAKPSRKVDTEDQVTKVQDALGGHGIILSMGSAVLVCQICSKYKVKTEEGKTRRSHHKCTCGAVICNPLTTNKVCWITHLVQCVDKDMWNAAREIASADWFKPQDNVESL